MYPGGGSLKRFVKVLRLWDFVLSIKMALFERSEFDIFMSLLAKYQSLSTLEPMNFPPPGYTHPRPCISNHTHHRVPFLS